jgi:hypothetical protein
MTVNISALGNAQAIGWSDAPITRNAANQLGLPTVLLTQGTITADAKIMQCAATWNNAAVTFTAIMANLTDTASNAASLLIDLQVGGASKFKVDKAGIMSLGTSGVSFNPASTTTLDVRYSGGTTPMMRLSSSLLAVVGGVSAAASGGSAASPDVYWYRDAANIWAQRNSTNAQTNRLYGTYTDASNYRRISLAMTTAGVATLLPEGAGTGASGNVLHISGLPTSNPGPGILWNNAGTPAIGT